MKDTKKKLISALQIIISLALLAYIVWKNDPQQILNTLQAIDMRWYLPAFVLFILTIILRAYRWYLLIRTLDNRPSFIYLVYLYFVGFFANNFIPSGFGGDVVKIATLRQSTGKGAEAASSVVMERATGLLGSTLVAIVALIWNHYSPNHVIDLPQGLWLLIVALSVAIPLFFVGLRLFNPFLWLHNWFPMVSKIPKYETLIELSGSVKRYPFPVLRNSLLVSLPFTIMFIVLQFYIAKALGVTLPISVFSLFVPLISIFNLLPISFNGLGVRETLYQFLFVPIGVEPATAVSMSLAFLFLRLASGIIGGILLMGRNLSALRQAPQPKNL